MDSSFVSHSQVHRASRLHSTVLAFSPEPNSIVCGTEDYARTLSVAVFIPTKIHCCLTSPTLLQLKPRGGGLQSARRRLVVCGTVTDSHRGCVAGGINSVT